MIVTVAPCGSVPPVGLCASTSPSWVGSVTSCVDDVTREPGLLEDLGRRPPGRHRVTFGTPTSFGPFETVSVTVVPGGCERAAGRRSARRPGRPAPRSATSVAGHLEAGALERARGVRVRLADDDGTPICLGPVRDVERAPSEPDEHGVPAAGDGRGDRARRDA